MYFFYEVVLHYKTFSREVYSESSLNTNSLFSWNKYNVILTEKCGSLLRNRFWSRQAALLPTIPFLA